jgi:competence protein ComEC
MEGKQPPRAAAPAAAAGAPWRAGAAVGLRATLAWERRVRQLHALLALEADRRTAFNWLPVAFGAGIGAYFAADRDPLWWGPWAAFLLFAGAGWALRERPLARLVFAALCAASAGLAAGALRTERVAAPNIERVTIGKLSGFVESVEERTADLRLVLLTSSFADLPADKLPGRVRIVLRKTPILAGEHIALTARLLPPPEAARPGGYDFARDAFFRGFGAVGSGLGQVERAAWRTPPPLAVRINAAVDAARNVMTQRIASLIGGQAGAVAAALVTGKRGLISEETNEILRGAGIYHIVSISGLHMVLAAGAIFWLSRALLALAPALALRWPIKKIAAVLAMFGATGYCIFSGSEVATERSLIMTLIMLGAILADRPALSMRNWALAALVVLALEPDSLLGPSFQMSFAAVGALIAFAEWDRRRPRVDPVEPGLVGRTLRTARLAVVGMFVTSILAALATGPFGAYHFQTYNPYGLLGNMLALPFVSLVVMPAAVVGALLYPLGLDAAAWWVMGLATEPVLAVSRHVAGLGGSTQVAPAYGLIALLCLSAGLLLIILLTTRLRWLGLIPLLSGVALAANPSRPDIYVDREGSGAAARAVDGRLVALGRPTSFVLEQWLKADGDGRKPDAARQAGTSCDAVGCVIALPSGRTVAWSRDPVAVSEDCGRASLVITPLRWDGACAALMIDRRTLDRYGSMSIRDDDKGFAARTSRRPDAARPWTRREPERPAQTALPPEAPVSSDEEG